jgi:Methyltransferase domain
MAAIGSIVAEIARLPHDWHMAGSVDPAVLKAIVRHVDRRQVSHSVETGSGKTTLLFSHLSQDHKIFAIEGDNRSISSVRESHLLNRATVEFIEGPTQLTLPNYRFAHQLQVAYMDGPHGYPFPDLEYYYLYPHLAEDALLIVDDIHIPTIHHLFDFLREDAMFRLLEVVDNTAFFVRTSTPTFDPYGDGWWLQQYNKRRFPIEGLATQLRRKSTAWLLKPLKRRIKRVLGKES